jgi:7,8-dihydro-6-hydroxymethylpterin-pyrophosphokinase
MWERRFVLCPLAEIAPGLRDPATGRTVREILDRINDGFEVRPAIIRGAEPTGLEHPGR